MPMNSKQVRPNARPTPFDAARLDSLLEDAELDLLIVTSKHNVQYLLGGYRSLFFDYMDAFGVSRYLPIFVDPEGEVQVVLTSPTAWRSSRKSSGAFGRP